MRNIDEIKEVFEAFNGDYLDESGVVNKKANRGDLCAFMILDELFPSNCDIVCGADHDVIYLECDVDLICTLTDEVIHDLVRCGVSMDEDGLFMFA